MFEILNIHGIVKCLTRATEGLGPSVDIEVAKTFAEKSKYKVGNRKIPTPRGPLFEYVFYSEPSPENKIFFSRNGFSVDMTSTTISLLMDLVNEAYHWYEVATQTPTFKPLLESIITCYVHSPKLSPIKYMQTLFPGFKKKPINAFNKQLRPLSITLTSTYHPEKEKSSLVVKVEPFVKSPTDKFRVFLTNRHETITEVLESLKKIEKTVLFLLGKLIKSSRR